MYSTPQLVLVFVISCLVFVPSVFVQGRAISSLAQYNPGPSSSPSAVDQTPGNPADKPLMVNSTLQHASDAAEEDDEDDIAENIQGNNLQARHGRPRRGHCSRRSKRHGCRKSAKKLKKVVHSAASTVHHAVTLASTGVTRSGQATYYGTGLGACGMTSNDASMIAAASHLLFDNFPGATANPNKNPICGRQVKATYQGKSVVVQIVDRCVGCQIFDLDFSPTAFGLIGPMAKGRLSGMTWQFM